MGLTWNSWYNPLDNIASAGRTVKSGITGAAYGGAGNSPVAQTAYNSANQEFQKSGAQTVGAYDPNAGQITNPQVFGQTTGGATTNSWDGAGYTDPQTAALQSAQSSWLSALPGSLGMIGQNGSDAFGSAQRNLQGGAESLFNTINQGQKAINTSRDNVELGRLSGIKDIISFVRNGIRQGGMRLANGNATESSAAGELGRIYSQMGGDRSRAVNNKAFIDNRNIDTQQGNLDLQKTTGVTDWNRQRDEIVSNIGQQVRSQLAQLDAQGTGMGITGKINVDAEKQKIIDAGMAQLNQVDGWLRSQMGGITPQDMATTKTNAIALQNGGQSDVTPFDFGTFAGQQMMGPAIDQLPLFTRVKKVNQA